MDPSFHPYVDKDIPWLLKMQSETNPDKAHLIWEPVEGETEVWTYKRLYDDARSLAAGLNQRGISKGDYVLIHMNNCPEFLICWHACAMLGAIAVTTNTRSAQVEMDYFVEHSKVTCAITQPEFVDKVRVAGPELNWIATTKTNSGTPVEQTSDEVIVFDELYGDGSSLPLRKADPMLPLSVQYTSGTTSRPKGVVWTHANALWGGQVGTSHNQIGRDDCAIVFTPLFHTNAMSWAHFPILWSGGTMVLQPKFSASRFWPIVEKHNCSWANVIPFAVGALATLPVPEKHDFRYWVVGAANVGDAEKLFRVPFVGAWGMTELIIHGTYTQPTMKSPPISMGMPVPEYKLKVVNEETNEPVKHGEAGLLKVKGIPGISLFLEYLHNEEATTSCFDEDGWFDTGDRVQQVEEGHFRFSDRSKDMLKVGAENVAASEIESVVKSVEGVIEAAVVGKPDPMRQEVPVAFVQSPSASDILAELIINKCRENLADFKVPVDVIFVDDYPRAELNKIAKNKLRERFT